METGEDLEAFGKPNPKGNSTKRNLTNYQLDTEEKEQCIINSCDLIDPVWMPCNHKTWKSCFNEHWRKPLKTGESITWPECKITLSDKFLKENCLEFVFKLIQERKKNEAGNFKYYISIFGKKRV